MVSTTRRMRRVAAIALVAALLAGGAAAARMLFPRTTSTQRVRAPLAAVLVPRPGRVEVVMVDLAAMTVARRVPLRSLATDVAADTVSGRFVTAQSGGVGPDADDALGVLDPGSAEVRYVRLAQPNPGNVVCIGGRAYVLHGLCAGGRMFVSVVDVAAGRLERSGTVPETSGLWDVADGDLWTLAVSTDGGTNMLVRIDPSDLTTVAAYPADGLAGSMLAGGKSLYLLYGARTGSALEATSGSIAEMDSATGAAVRGVVVPGLSRGVSRGALAGSRMAVIDWNGEEPEGDTVALIDRDTLRVAAMVRIGGVPCALAEWDHRVLAVDRTRGRLVVIDATSGRVTGSVDLGARDLVFADVAVLRGDEAGVQTAEAASGP